MVISTYILILYIDKEVIVPGLYAAGEAACVSVHGANRLGANSLLDIVVFGRACAQHIKETMKPSTLFNPYIIDDPSKSDTLPLSLQSTRTTLNNLEKLLSSNGDLSTSQIRLSMQKTMQEFAAVFRTQETLDKGSSQILSVARQLEQLRISDKSLIWYFF